jgi:hypothetical protein
MTNGDQPQVPSPSEFDLDRAKLELEKWRAEEDFKLRRDELEVKRKEASKSSPLLLGVIGLFATVLASTVQNSCQTYASKNLESQRFESTEIQKALETDDSGVVRNRLARLLDLDLIRDETLKNKLAKWRDNPASIPLDSPGDGYTGGDDRTAARLSFATSETENFNDVSELMATLPSVDEMTKLHIPLDDDSTRVPQENRNVHVRGFLYAASRDCNNNFRLIVGLDPNSARRMYISMEVSGLPSPESPAFGALNAARAAYKQFFGAKNLPTAGYHFYQPPIPVEVDGSLFFDATALDNVGIWPGPPSLKSHIGTFFEVDPITRIKLGP